MADNIDLFKIFADLQIKDPVKFVREVQSILKGLTADIKLNIDKKSVNVLNKNLGVLARRGGEANKIFYEMSKAASEANLNIERLNKGLSTFNQISKTTIDQTRARVSEEKKGTETTKRAANVWQELGHQTALTTKRYLGFLVVARGLFGGLRQVSAAITEAIKLNSELSKVSVLSIDPTQINSLSAIKANSEGIRNLSKQIFEDSKKFAASQDQLIAGALTLAQTGASLSEIKTILSDISKISLLPTFEGVDKTVDGLIAIYNQFNLKASDTNEILSSFFGIAANYAVEVGDLFNVVKRAGAVYNALSDSTKEPIDRLKELAAITSIVRSSTRQSAETIGTSLRTIFARIQRPKVIEFLKEFNIELIESGKFVGGLEAIQRIQAELSKLPTNSPKFIRIVEQIAGLRQLDKAVPLIREAAKATEVLQAAKRGESQVTFALEQRQKDLGVQITNTFNIYKQFIQELTNSSGFRIAARAILSLADAFGEFLRTIRVVIPYLTALAAFKFGSGAAGDILVGINSKLKGFGVKQFLGLAGGGQVPVMLTPGEAVFSPAQVQKIGLNNLQKLNNKNFARGGFVVPGVGNTDSYPTNLPAGSFVLKKSASKAIGFARGGRVGFASGGNIDPLTNASKEAIKATEEITNIWSKYTENSYGLINKIKGKYTSESTLNFKNNTASLYLDLFQKTAKAPAGTGKEIIKNILKETAQYNPTTISGNFTNPQALGAFASVVGKENIKFFSKLKKTPANVSFEEAIKNPAQYIAQANIPSQFRRSVNLPFSSLNIADNQKAQIIVKDFVEAIEQAGGNINATVEQLKSTFSSSRTVDDALTVIKNRTIAIKNLGPGKSIGSFISATNKLGIPQEAQAFAISRAKSVAGGNSARLLTELEKLYEVFQSSPEAIKFAVQESTYSAKGNPAKFAESLDGFVKQIAQQPKIIPTKQELIRDFISAAKSVNANDIQIGQAVAKVRSKTGFSDINLSNSTKLFAQEFEKLKSPALSKGKQIDQFVRSAQALNISNAQIGKAVANARSASENFKNLDVAAYNFKKSLQGFQTQFAKQTEEIIASSYSTGVAIAPPINPELNATINRRFPVYRARQQFARIGARLGLTPEEIARQDLLARQQTFAKSGTITDLRQNLAKKLFVKRKANEYIQSVNQVPAPGSIVATSLENQEAVLNFARRKSVGKSPQYFANILEKAAAASVNRQQFTDKYVTNFISKAEAAGANPQQIEKAIRGKFVDLPVSGRASTVESLGKTLSRFQSGRFNTSGAIFKTFAKANISESTRYSAKLLSESIDPLIREFRETARIFGATPAQIEKGVARGLYYASDTLDLEGKLIASLERFSPAFDRTLLKSFSTTRTGTSLVPFTGTPITPLTKESFGIFRGSGRSTQTALGRLFGTEFNPANLKNILATEGKGAYLKAIKANSNFLNTGRTLSGLGKSLLFPGLIATDLLVRPNLRTDSKSGKIERNAALALDAVNAGAFATGIAGLAKTSFISKALPSAGKLVSAVGGPLAVGGIVAGGLFAKSVIDNREKNRLEVLDIKRKQSLENLFGNADQGAKSQSLQQLFQIQEEITKTNFGASQGLGKASTLAKERAQISIAKRGKFLGTGAAIFNTIGENLLGYYFGGTKGQNARAENIRTLSQDLQKQQAQEFVKQLEPASKNTLKNFSDKLKNSNINISDTQEVANFLQNFVANNAGDVKALGVTAGFARNQRLGKPIDLKSLNNNSTLEGVRFLQEQLDSLLLTGKTQRGKTDYLIQNFNLFNNVIASLGNSLDDITRGIGKFDNEVSIAAQNIGGAFQVNAGTFSADQINNSSILGLPSINELRSLREGLPTLIASSLIGGGDLVNADVLNKEGLRKQLESGNTPLSQTFNKLPRFLKDNLEQQIEKAFNGDQVDFSNIGGEIEQAMSKIASVIESQNSSLAKAFNERNKLELNAIQELSGIIEQTSEARLYVQNLGTIDPSKIFQNTISGIAASTQGKLQALGLGGNVGLLQQRRVELLQSQESLQRQIQQNPTDVELIKALDLNTRSLILNNEALNTVKQSNEKQITAIQSRIQQIAQQKDQARNLVQGLVTKSPEELANINIGNQLAVQAINGRTRFRPEELQAVFGSLNQFKQFAGANPEKFNKLTGLTLDDINNIEGRITNDVLKNKTTDPLLLALGEFQASGAGQSPEEKALIGEFKRLTNENINILQNQNKLNFEQIDALGQKITAQAETFQIQLDTALAQADNLNSLNKAIDRIAGLENIPNDITISVELPDLNVNFSQDLQSLEPYIKKLVQSAIRSAVDREVPPGDVDSP